MILKNLPWRGLKRSLPKSFDLKTDCQYWVGGKERNGSAYLNVMPYCETCSNPDFHTSVTSQALVAWSLQDRNAETELPPTDNIRNLGG